MPLWQPPQEVSHVASFDPYTIGAAQALGANTAHWCAVTVPRPITVSTIAFYLGIAAGNCDVGIYRVTSGSPPTRTLTRVVSSGSTDSSAGGGAIKAVAITATVLSPGQIYYLCLAFDGAVAAVGTPGTTVASLYVLAADRNIYGAIAASFPLPASIVCAAAQITNTPPFLVAY